LSDAHHGNIFSTRITPDEKYIISTSWDSTVKVWDIGMRSLLKTFEHASYKVDSNIGKICVSPNS
jgi:WD40 repeat protein